MEAELPAETTLKSTSALLDGVVARDEEAFGQLVAAFDADLLRLAFVIAADADSAQDAVQSTWERLWQQPPRLREPDRLRSWLLSVAANEARQTLRRRRRGSVLERWVPVAAGEGDPGLRAPSMDVEQALLTLSVQDREVLTLRYVLDLDSVEVGKHLGMSPEGVRTRARRALSRLREELGDE